MCDRPPLLKIAPDSSLGHEKVYISIALPAIRLAATFPSLQLPENLVVPSYLYRILKKDDLAKACQTAKLDDKGKKDDLIKRLLLDGARMELLSKDALQTLCSRLDLPYSGNKPALIERLNEGGPKALCQSLGLPVSDSRAQMIEQIRKCDLDQREGEDVHKVSAISGNFDTSLELRRCTCFLQNSMSVACWTSEL